MRVAIKRRSDASATRSMPPGALAANSSQASFETACRSRVVGEKLGFMSRLPMPEEAVGRHQLRRLLAQAPNLPDPARGHDLQRCQKNEAGPVGRRATRS